MPKKVEDTDRLWHPGKSVGEYSLKAPAATAFCCIVSDSCLAQTSNPKR